MMMMRERKKKDKKEKVMEEDKVAELAIKREKKIYKKVNYCCFYECFFLSLFNFLAF